LLRRAFMAVVSLAALPQAAGFKIIMEEDAIL